MHKTTHALCGVIAFAVLAVRLAAQAPVCEDGGVVDLRLNGTKPTGALPLDHVVTISEPTLTVTLTRSGTTSVPFLLLAGTSIIAANRTVPWGGSIDVDPVSIVLDGLFPATAFDLTAHTNFSITVPVPTGLVGMNGPALQAIHTEAANGPYFLDNTTSAMPFFATTRTVTYSSVADDAFVAHQVVCPITFGGVIYTQLYAGSNGQVTFGVGSTDPHPSAANFFAGFRAPPTPPNQANPGVAALWADYFRSTVATDSIVVFEDRTAQTVKVTWSQVEWYNSQTPAGTFSVTFGQNGANSVRFNLTGTAAGSGGSNPGIGTNDPNPIVGVTDGNSTIGTDYTVDLSAVIAAGGGSWTAAAGPASVAEVFPLSGGDPMQPLDIGILDFEDPLGTFHWTIH